ncbi:AraC family transcriptional regulator [Sphingomonas kyeonggiensis]|uniref:helix-turn-helix domain-containing protein n=1 Tax=Sphingomonas kyeonggiensis TaxID=1268553 RepID=UPI00277FCFA5|nr:AraC family transcriptional regulator [Sphingomonas kyeonggiensis]MDQ0248802.1 AraC family transcriptional regulator [Sphingomonas kyeonggiensis]
MRTNRSQTFLRVRDAASVTFEGPGNFPIGAARLRSETSGLGMTDPHLIEDAFLINVQLRDYAGEIFLNGRKLAFHSQGAGQTVFFDYRRNWRANLRTAFDCLNFHVDRRAFGFALTDEAPAEVEDLQSAPGEPMDDGQLYGLALAMRPVFDHPHEANRLFLEHIGWALCSHLASRYGITTAKPRPIRGGLAAWQERRTKELIEASLDGNISLNILAEECGLSRAHFARSFRQSTGMPPHQWLLERRVDRAREMLRDERIPISEVAIHCGFADQSHLSRVFRKFAGVSPLAWRKSQGRRI